MGSSAKLGPLPAEICRTRDPVVTDGYDASRRRRWRFERSRWKRSKRYGGAGRPASRKKRIARQLGIGIKTARSYVTTAEAAGLALGASLGDDAFAKVLASLPPLGVRPRGPIPAGVGVAEAWATCEAHRAEIKELLDRRVKLTKVRRLLSRKGFTIPYAALRRSAIAELGFANSGATIPVSDGEPGAEVQLETGWLLALEPDIFKKRRRVRSWIFTAVRLRHRFVYPCFEETTKTAIEACEAAWEHFGGVLRGHRRQHEGNHHRRRFGARITPEE